MIQLIDQTERSYVLLTGSTGLVGQYLLRQLLEADQRVAVVVRPSKKLTARERIEAIMQRWESIAGRSLPRPIVFAGDVCESKLGMNEEALEWIGKNCNRVIHSAAVLTFHGSSMDADPWRTNLGGTKHVLELCKQFKFKELHYLSTAYVSGKRTDRVMEDDLDCGQEFRNDYERCKCEAEKLVRAADYIPSKTVYRPAVIIGDSQTGYTATYHGLFLYLRLMATLVPQQKRNAEGVIETPLRLPMSGEEPRNLVTVDWVADVVTHIFLRPEAHGQTYHLTPDHFCTARQVIEYGYEYFGSEGVVFAGKGAARDPDSEFAAKYFENAGMYEAYETSDPTFDNSRLKAVTGHLECPQVDRDMVFRFMEFGANDRWGKRRPKPPEVNYWAADHLDELKLAAKGAMNDLSNGGSIAIDLRGTGGGQWVLAKDSLGEIHIQCGVSDDCESQIVADMADIASEEQSPRWESIFANLLAAQA